MSSTAQVFSSLARIAAEAEAHALPLPAREEIKELWRGLGFHIGATRMVAPMGDVVEVLAVPPMTPVPSAKRWMRGVANLRGRLMPVIDLCRFTGVERTTPRSDWRVLVIEQGEVFCGLQVEHSFGMLQFEQDEYEDSTEGDDNEQLEPFLLGAFRQGGRTWRVMDLKRFVNDPRFFEVAA